MGFLKTVREFFKKQQQEMKNESVATVDFEISDCCNPPDVKKKKPSKNNAKGRLKVV